MLRQLSRPPPAPHAALMLVLAHVMLAEPARADAPVSTTAPGATLEEVLAIARRLSPDLAARALDTEAAQARVDIAGSLADPMLRITSDEIDRTGGPRQNKMYYTVEQEFPLWGKRDLKRAQAGAEVARTHADARMTEAELIEKVKVAFAQYYQADQAIRTTENLHRVVHDIARVAQDRYAQGRGSQQEVYKAEVEITRLSTELVRLEAKRRSSTARLNALLARPIDAPLAQPVKLRPLPSEAALAPAALMERARGGNPSLAGGDAQIASAAAGKQLADKNWYPDVTLKAGAIDRTGNGRNGYLAEIGLRVPLQWGLHEPSSVKQPPRSARRRRGGKRSSSRSKATSANLLPISAAAARRPISSARSSCRKARRCCAQVSPATAWDVPSSWTCCVPSMISPISASNCSAPSLISSASLPRSSG
jgi:outer membrane protein TolC